MPQRLLRPTLRQSERWNRLPLFEQNLFVRLLTMVDDYGRYEAHPMLIRNEAYPYGDENGKDIPLPKIESALLALSDNNSEDGMLILYKVNGKRYLSLRRWKERVRTDSKYPDPDSEMSDKCLTNDSTIPSQRQQMLASPPSPTPTPVPTPTPSALQVRVGKWFHRRETTKWGDSELRGLKKVEKLETNPADLDVLEAFYTATIPKDDDFRRRSIETLFNHWQGEIDKAKKWAKSCNRPTGTIPGWVPDATPDV
jgi:hypothetical protein